MKHISKFSLLLMLTIALFSNFSAKAAETVDLGALQPDVTYHFPDMCVINASYTPTKSGPVRFLWSVAPIPLYSEAGHPEESYVDGDHAYTANGQLISYSYLEEGHTYYIYTAFNLNATDLLISEGEAELKLEGSTPSLDPDAPDYYGGKFSASQYYRIDLDFNYPVSVGNCLLIGGDESYPLSPIINNATVSFDVYEPVMNLYNEGFIKEGDTMTLRLLKVADANNPDVKYGTNGRLELDFVMADKPAELKETKGYSAKSTSNPLNSFYLPGDSAGVMQLIFDKNISTDCNPVANIAYGNTDNLDLGVYRETINGVVDGNVVSFDFTNKLRRRIDMIPGAESSDLPFDLFVSYSGIYTPDGQRAFTGMMSNPTGFSASYVINELQYTVAADFSPVRGAALRPGADMEIWVMNGSKIQFDDIAIDYVENSEPKTLLIGKDNIQSSVDEFSTSGDDLLFNFKVPEYCADADTKVKVYMTNVVCADGLDHSKDIVGEFVSATSGVAGIAGDADASADVFDITGRVVLRSASRASLSSLPAGIYIHNGKKIIVR